MKIKYIIDYKGFGSTFTLTTTHNGECIDISKDQAKEYLDCSNVFISIKAEVNLKSVYQKEITNLHPKSALWELKMVH